MKITLDNKEQRISATKSIYSLKRKIGKCRNIHPSEIILESNGRILRDDDYCGRYKNMNSRRRMRGGNFVDELGIFNMTGLQLVLAILLTFILMDIFMFIYYKFNGRNRSTMGNGGIMAFNNPIAVPAQGVDMKDKSMIGLFFIGACMFFFSTYIIGFWSITARSSMPIGLLFFILIPLAAMVPYVALIILKPHIIRRFPVLYEKNLLIFGIIMLVTSVLYTITMYLSYDASWLIPFVSIVVVGLIIAMKKFFNDEIIGIFKMIATKLCCDITDHNNSVILRYILYPFALMILPNMFVTAASPNLAIR